MVNHVQYAKSVKSVDARNIRSLLSTIDAGSKDFVDSLGRLKAENIDLSKNDDWAVVASIVKNVSRVIPSFNSKSPIQDVLNMAAATLSHVAPELIKLVNGYKDTVWSGHNLTVRQVYILSSIEQYEFWLSYANRLLDIMLTRQVEADFKIDRYLTKGELSFINGALEYFNTVTITLLEGKSKILKDIQTIPELDAEDETGDEILKGMGFKPPQTAQGFGIHLLNPAYWYDELVKEINLIRIKRMQENNEYLAMKINQAINQKNGQDDAALDFRLETYRNKIIKNTAKMNEIVDSYKD